MKIGYVCTNYNNSHYTVEAVRSFMADKSCKEELFVVVVDNDSADVEKEKLKKLQSQYNNVDVIFNEKNVGYFAGLNVGIQRLRDRILGIEWVFIGNNDLEFPEEWTEKFVKNVSKIEEYPVISPDIVTLDGVHQNPHVVFGISRFREMMYDIYYSNYYIGLAVHWLANRMKPLAARKDAENWKDSQFIAQGHGSCYILGPKFFREFGQLWAPTFLMSEEFFISKQIGDAGYRIYYEPAIKVKHHWHGTLASLPSYTRWCFAREAHKVYRKHVKYF